MLWLQTPPWGRWALAAAIVLFVIWTEVRPDPNIDHPFASRHITSGEAITGVNTSTRPVPRGLFEPIPDEATARRDIPMGAPVLSQDLGGTADAVPEGWWIVTLEVPAHAASGSRVRVVVVDTGLAVDGFVTSVSESSGFGGSNGGVAIPGEHATAVAAAAVNGRVAVLVSTD